MIGFAYLAASAILLTLGAELFAEHAGAAGRRLGVTVLAVGLVLAGAEPEELVTALFASLGHRPGIAAGDAIGANLTMLTLVVGLAAVFRPVPFGPRIRGYALAASGAGAAAAVTLLDGRVDRIEGVILVLLYVALLALVWWRERRPPAFGEAADLDGDDDLKGVRAPWSVSLVVVGVAVMAVGGRIAVAGAERVVTALGLADSAVGLTFVALATTAELLALVWAAARRGVEELAIAGVLGSAAYNATATLGVAALARPLVTSGVSRPAWAASAFPLILIAASRGHRIGRRAGVALLACYVVFVAVTLH